MFWLVAAAVIAWSALVAQPWMPWRMRERLEPAATPGTALTGSAATDDIGVLIPARNEADAIADALAGVAAQGRFAQVILIDDQSTDGTAGIARDAAQRLGLANFEVVDGKAPPSGASGKLWALTQGFSRLKTDRVLLLDADILLAPGMVAALETRQRQGNLGLVSLMAHLSMQRPWERVLVPAFIYFFKLLYPFALANRPGHWMAAAAGGCILTTREALERIGGFESIQGALIDDCTLARRIKRTGFATFVGVTHGARSARPYQGLGEIWNMVARTAFTQLNYSWALLAACTLLMLLYFVVPGLGLAVAVFRADAGLAAAALLALALMVLSYAPTLRFYRLPLWRTLTLPLAGALYLAMTLSSAWRYAHGVRSTWKARVYDTELNLDR